MTEPQQGPSAADLPTDDRRDPPVPASSWAAEQEPTTESERESLETVRSISRLEEAN
jgi:hypothetical protein